MGGDRSSRYWLGRALAVAAIATALAVGGVTAAGASTAHLTPSRVTLYPTPTGHEPVIVNRSRTGSPVAVSLGDGFTLRYQRLEKDGRPAGKPVDSTFGESGFPPYIVQVAADTETRELFVAIHLEVSDSPYLPQAIVLRVDQRGKITRTYTPQASGEDFSPTGIAVDAGGVYVYGSVGSPENASSLRKLNRATGDVEWTRSFSGTSDLDAANPRLWKFDNGNIVLSHERRINYGMYSFVAVVAPDGTIQTDAEYSTQPDSSSVFAVSGNDRLLIGSYGVTRDVRLSGSTFTVLSEINASSVSVGVYGKDGPILGGVADAGRPFGGEGTNTFASSYVGGFDQHGNLLWADTLNLPQGDTYYPSSVLQYGNHVLMATLLQPANLTNVNGALVQYKIPNG